MGPGQWSSGLRSGGPSPGRSRGRPSPGRSRGEPSPGRSLMANGADDSEGSGRIAAATWRLSLRVSMSKRARRVLRAHPSKSCGQLPVIPGLEVFTIRSLGLTSLRGMGVHPEVRAPTRGTPRLWLPRLPPPPPLPLLLPLAAMHCTGCHTRVDGCPREARLPADSSGDWGILGAAAPEERARRARSSLRRIIMKYPAGSAAVRAVEPSRVVRGLRSAAAPSSAPRRRQPHRVLPVLLLLLYSR